MGNAFILFGMNYPIRRGVRPNAPTPLAHNLLGKDEPLPLRHWSTTSGARTSHCPYTSIQCVLRTGGFRTRPYGIDPQPPGQGRAIAPTRSSNAFSVRVGSEPAPTNILLPSAFGLFLSTFFLSAMSHQLSAKSFQLSPLGFKLR